LKRVKRIEGEKENVMKIAVREIMGYVLECCEVGWGSYGGGCFEFQPSKSQWLLYVPPV
jgi:hypothetical protein